MEPVAQSESVELNAPWGAIRATGRETVLVLILILGFVSLGSLLYLHHREQVTAHLELMEASDEQTFFLSLPEGEREKYRLKMPGSLWKKLASGGMTTSPSERP